MKLNESVKSMVLLYGSLSALVVTIIIIVAYHNPQPETTIHGTIVQKWINPCDEQCYAIACIDKDTVVYSIVLTGLQGTNTYKLHDRVEVTLTLGRLSYSYLMVIVWPNGKLEETEVVKAEFRIMEWVQS